MIQEPSTKKASKSVSKKYQGNPLDNPPPKSQLLDDGYTQIPSFVFRDRSVAVLESLVEYLKDAKNLSYHEIAILLNRNDRTIWTVYHRVKMKRKNLSHRGNE